MSIKAPRSKALESRMVEDCKILGEDFSVRKDIMTNQFQVCHKATVVLSGPKKSVADALHLAAYVVSAGDWTRI